VFSSGFPHHVEDFSTSDIFTVMPIACGEASQPRHGCRSRPPGGGGQSYGIRKGRLRFYEYGYDTLWMVARSRTLGYAHANIY
jgi:hypothetical protein